MELPGIWHSVDDGEIYHVVTGLGFIPMQMKFWSPGLPKPKENEARWLFFVYMQIILELQISHKVIGSEITTVEGVQELTI